LLPDKPALLRTEENMLIDTKFTDKILAFLGVKRGEPSVEILDELVAAYTRTVPWESASRIAKRVTTPATERCPRWPSEFWLDAFAKGAGGTCYESNYAFFSLLDSLGFQGYLTINDMGDLQGCHSAIVVQLDSRRWLVDVGYPLYLPVPLDAHGTTRRQTPFHTYTVTPSSQDRYEVTRDRHPKPYVFTLVDRPVADDVYRAITTADYGANGQFLDEVIIHKNIDGRIWRYNGREAPPVLESFSSTGERKALGSVDAQDLATLFRMDASMLATAMAAVEKH
jgi:arylamine N-acetyltransferase